MAPAKYSLRRLLAASLAAAFLTACSGAQELANSAPVSSPGVSASEADGAPEPAAPPVNSGTAVTVLAGSMVPGCLDGEALAAQFIKPYGLCAGADGALILADSYGNQIRQIRQGTVSTLAGMSAADASGLPLGGYRNGAAGEAYLNRPRFLDASLDGTIVFSDSANNMIRACRDGLVYALAGAPERGYRDGDFREARFNLPSGVAISGDGTVYVADTLNHCIRTISPGGRVSTLAGRNESGFADGTLEEALFNEPNDLALGSDGALYVVDKGNQRIRRIYGNTVSTVAGGGTETDKTTGYILGGFEDGPAQSARFLYPTGLCTAPDGGIYIADTGNNCIRELRDGRVSTVTGSRVRGGQGGGRLNQPLDVLYLDGRLYVTDSYNHTVKSIDLTAEAEEGGVS